MKFSTSDFPKRQYCPHMALKVIANQATQGMNMNLIKEEQ